MKFPLFLIARCLAAIWIMNAHGATIQVKVGSGGRFTSRRKVLGPLRGTNGSYSAKYTVTNNLGGSASAPVKGR